MYGGYAAETTGSLTAIEERWKIMYNEQHRTPTYTTSHYIAYLRRYVNDTGQLRAAATSDRRDERRARTLSPDRRQTTSLGHDSQRSLDSISPISYFIRKLKLDLKLSYISFVEEFVQAPNNGLRLLLCLLKNLQVLSSNPIGAFPRSTPKGTLRMEEYKKNMVDEHDCLLCIKYTLRMRGAVEELLEHNTGLYTVVSCLLSNYSRSRITVLEILTLILTGPSSVDKVLDAFTSMRIQYAEGTRFKMLINMMYTRGVSHVLFQVSCLRLLNSLLNLCKSANMRVYLQYEMEEAGLDWNRIHEGAQGVGLEYDDLKKEILEWKLRYIDVDSLLRKIKADLKSNQAGSALTEFIYDQHFGPIYSTQLAKIDDFPDPQGLNGQNGWRPLIQEIDVKTDSDPALYFPKRTSSRNSSRIVQIEVHPPIPSKDRSITDPPSQDSENFSPQETPRGATDPRDPYPPREKTKHLAKRISFSSEVSESQSQTGKQYEGLNGRNEEMNWILRQGNFAANSDQDDGERGRKGQERRKGVGHRKDDKGGHFDSGVSVDYHDGDPLTGNYWDDDNTQNSYLNGGVEKETGTIIRGNGLNNNSASDSKNFKVYTPRALSAPENDELGYLHWLNQEILNPQLSRIQLYPNDGRQGYQKSNRKPSTPTPDYGALQENGQFAKSQYHIGNGNIDTDSSLSHSNTGRVSLNDQNGTINQNSNFQRMHNIRRRGATEEQRTSPGEQRTSSGGQRAPPAPPLPPSMVAPSQQQKQVSVVTAIQQNARNYSTANGHNRSPQSSHQNQFNPQVTKRTSAGSVGRSKKSSSVGSSQRDLMSPSTLETASQHHQNPSIEIREKSPLNGNAPIPAPRDQKHKAKTTIYVNGNKTNGVALPDARKDSQHKEDRVNVTLFNKKAAIDSSALTSIIESDTNKGQHGIKDNSKVKSTSVIEPLTGVMVTSSEITLIKDAHLARDDSPRAAETSSHSKNLDHHQPLNDHRETLSNGVDSIRSYSTEIGRVLHELDETLETHGWQASIKKHTKQQRPLVAYV